MQAMATEYTVAHSLTKGLLFGMIDGWLWSLVVVVVAIVGGDDCSSVAGVYGWLWSLVVVVVAIVGGDDCSCVAGVCRGTSEEAGRVELPRFLEGPSFLVCLVEALFLPAAGLRGG